ncbi:MAG: sulfite exporter TauE/SafE family protein [Chitinophagaceae bacterium]|nr:MAG: sulfite exporter TauE/SafE family protein [Chitinophagaceae bacterium]
MDSAVILFGAGFLIGSLGTLIGAGGGFLLVPLLLLTHPGISPELVTAISLVVVACNAISGSIAYARSGRIDFKAGWLFAAATIPGSILGVFATKYIPAHAFNAVFGVILLLLSVFLFLKKRSSAISDQKISSMGKHLRHHILIDKENVRYEYSFNQYTGMVISGAVGFLSPLLGIGGGIIHVPALVHWLRFPVYVATATSHFILAIMATVSVVVHAAQGNYDDPYILHMIIWLAAGVIPGAQIGALLSHKIKGDTIVKALAVCLALVGLRLALGSL